MKKVHNLEGCKMSHKKVGSKRQSLGSFEKRLDTQNFQNNASSIKRIESHAHPTAS